ncbi:hypothetical protein BH11BAC7_BH11BAC7_20410 [soil metagenome]
MQGMFAQQANYFMLGEEQFRGIQIYNIIQDKSSDYWFATNNGIYHFDYYNYTKVTCEKSKSNSFFNFVIDSDGTIYCHNLNNQIFQIRDKKCTLFHELTKDEGAPDISLAITEEDKLIIGAKQILILNKNGSIANRYDPGSYLGPAFITNERAIQYHLSGTDSVLTYSKNKFSKHKLNTPRTLFQADFIFKFFRVENRYYAIDLTSKSVYNYNPENFTMQAVTGNELFSRSESVRIYETGNEIWVAGTLPGIFKLNIDFAVTNNTIYYPDYFISDVYKDREGNILLCTFDKGILVIPDLNMPDVISTFSGDLVSSLYADNDLGLILGSSEGKLMSYSKGLLTTISDKGKRPVEKIYGFPGSELILFDDGQIRAYNKSTNEMAVVTGGSLKDVAFITGHLFYVGTNSGIAKCRWESGKTFSTEKLAELDYRIYAIEFNSSDKLLYAATSNGLYCIDSTGANRLIIYRGESIYPNDLFYDNGKIYVCDKWNGILVLENGMVRTTIQPIVNGKVVALTKMIIHNEMILAKSADGFYEFDRNGKLIMDIPALFGFSSKRAIDFTFDKTRLWVSHTGGVQQIDLNYLQHKKVVPGIQIKKIFVNEEERSLTEKGNFTSEQRKIKFVLYSGGLRNRELLHYYYKLEGYDANWNSNNLESNEIMYNALAPGNYNLLVKAEKQGVFSDIVSYSFSIAKPFYARWWFIAASIILFLLIVIFVYKTQLNIQRKKSQQLQELNASRLTAIQSQMNPHFIFNALNSIQDLVLKGDVENSYSYITKFSNLVRRTLNYSEKDFIDFEQEIKLLELYLSLEKLRFKKDFVYTIEAQNVADIQVPPLLIQPFIENALIHGLLHKEGMRNLKITFELKEFLICIIEDNGIGREKAKAIKQRQKPEHESFSGKAIHRRFEILGNLLDGNFGYRYEDMTGNGIPSGTKVILRIPVKHKF